MNRNQFKARLNSPCAKIGLWVASGEPYLASMTGLAGFDWLVIDGEHAPNDLRSVLAQIQVLASSPAEIFVRPPAAEAWMIKQLLDIGARNLLIPMVDTPQQAREIVRSTRYPPNGTRGMGAGIGWASKFGTQTDYLTRATEEICILVQAETRTAIANLPAIAAIDGVDGVFIGPADLAADLGHPGNLNHPEVLRKIEAMIKAIVQCGKPAGILTFDEDLNLRCIEWGATLVAVGCDVTEFMNALRRLRGRYDHNADSPRNIAY